MDADGLKRLKIKSGLPNKFKADRLLSEQPADVTVLLMKFVHYASFFHDKNNLFDRVSDL